MPLYMLPMSPTSLCPQQLSMTVDWMRTTSFGKIEDHNMRSRKKTITRDVGLEEERAKGKKDVSG